jgi:rod shape determining protein RodA
MSRARIKSKGNFDWITLWIFFSLLTIGWLMIYAVEYKDTVDATIFNFSTSYGKQLVWIGLATVVVASALIINPIFWKVFSYPILLMACFLLLLVLFFGQEIKGSQSWFTFGFFSVQPGEIAKFPALIALSSFLSFHKTDITNNRGFFFQPCFDRASRWIDHATTRCRYGHYLCCSLDCAI